MGKTRIIAETGAGQHGVATATVCALKNMRCIVYMGETDIRTATPRTYRKCRCSVRRCGRSLQRQQNARRTRRTRLSATGAVNPSDTLLHHRFNGRPASLPRYGGPAAIDYQRVKSTQQLFSATGMPRLPGLPRSPASGEAAMPPGRFTNTSGTDRVKTGRRLKPPGWASTRDQSAATIHLGRKRALSTAASTLVMQNRRRAD